MAKIVKPKPPRGYEVISKQVDEPVPEPAPRDNEELLADFVAQNKNTVADLLRRSRDDAAYSFTSKLGESSLSILLYTLLFATCFWLFSLRGRSVFMNIVLFAAAVLLYFVVRGSWEKLKSVCGEFVAERYVEPSVVKEYISKEAASDISRISESLSQMVYYSYPPEDILAQTERLADAISFYEYAMTNAKPFMFKQ